LKKEKEEAFKRRVMGEKNTNKFEKENIRKKNQTERDEFDRAHLGQFKVVYPVLDNPVNQKSILHISIGKSKEI
jgi:mRNA-degrading endonuclease RelE of RelBE toxin-antitoxin system